jgi:hypothetical protein
MTPSDRLRAAGYVPLPRLWVTQEDMDIIAWMAKKHEGAVNAIRGEAIRDTPRQADVSAARP